jgi:hypothetical protein
LIFIRFSLSHSFLMRACACTFVEKSVKSLSGSSLLIFIHSLFAQSMRHHKKVMMLMLMCVHIIYSGGKKFEKRRKIRPSVQHVLCISSIDKGTSHDFYITILGGCCKNDVNWYWYFSLKFCLSAKMCERINFFVWRN